MIVSHQNGFIFLKTAKTAGTSLEIALSRFCGPRDIITPIEEADEAIRRKLHFNGPRNYQREGSDPHYKNGFYHHMPACDAIRALGGDVWGRYYKFCFTRNPWDRAVSHYFWYFKGKPPTMTISEFIRTPLVHRMFVQGQDVFLINGQIAVNEVFRYEDLPRALRTIKHRVGLPEHLVLPEAKTWTRTDRRPLREVLTDDDIEWLGQLFAYEIENFGYTPPV